MDTHIFFTTDKAQAASKTKEWADDGYAVMGIGPTDLVEIETDQTVNGLPLSLPDGSWYVVITTTAPHAG